MIDRDKLFVKIAVRKGYVTEEQIRAAGAKARQQGIPYDGNLPQVLLGLEVLNQRQIDSVERDLRACRFTCAQCGKESYPTDLEGSRTVCAACSAKPAAKKAEPPPTARTGVAPSGMQAAKTQVAPPGGGPAGPSKGASRPSAHKMQATPRAADGKPADTKSAARITTSRTAAFPPQAPDVTAEAPPEVAAKVAAENQKEHAVA